MGLHDKHCLNCMNVLGESNICPNCGYFQDTEQPEYCLKPGTILDGRYLIGNMISDNSEGITYIAYDNNIDSKIEIREYIPLELCKREEDSNNIIVVSGKESMFKALKSDFVDLAKTLSKFRTLSNLKQVYDVFEENKTVYYVGEYIEGNMTLSKFLKQAEGLLDWNVFSKMITPVINTLGILNASNIIHRGISTDTIYVTQKGNLKIGNFCISAVRAYKAELTSEILEGYAAPEQYSVNSWYGPWTDVYAISAVLYRVLTGLAPTDARERSIDEKLVYPRNINPSIPSKVSDSIVKGLKLSPENRVQSMQCLAALLSTQPETPNENEVVVNKNNKIRNKIILIISIIVAAIVLVAFGIFLVMFTLSGNNTKNNESIATLSLPSAISSRDTTSDDESDISSLDASYAMPNFIGMKYDTVIISKDYTDLVKIERLEDYSDKYTKGTIMKQSIPADTSIAMGTKVVLTVCVGPKTQIVPDYNGKTLSEYFTELDSLNIAYRVRLLDTTGQISGSIVSVTPGVGQTVDVSKNEIMRIVIDNTASSEISSTDSSSSLY